MWIPLFNSLITKNVRNKTELAKKYSVTGVVRKKVNAKAASHSSALIFCFTWVRCCQIAETNVMIEC